MNKNKCQSFLSLFLVSNLLFAIIFLIQVENGILSVVVGASSLANSTDIVSEGNSTFSNSGANGSDGEVDQPNVATVIIIPNPDSNSDSAHAASNISSSDIKESELETLNDTNIRPENNTSVLVPSTPTADEAKNQQTSNTNNSSTSPQLQRGEYLVDNNGIHYYNINNCSMVKGSSGIGNLSECEDAEREIQEELSG